MKLHSRVCDILNIEKPIVLEGMGGASCPALDAEAVSNTHLTLTTIYSV